MARPSKNGVDYFSHDTTSGKTIFTLESKFGNDGYAFWFKLLELLGCQDSLSIDCNSLPDWEFLIAKTKVSEITATEILDLLSRIDAIDAELWEEKIIWVQKFTDRLSHVFKKRKEDTPIKPSFCHRNNTSTVVPVEESTQSKVKESKVKESKVKDIYVPYETICEHFNSICKSLSKVVSITDKRKTKMKARWNELKTIEAFENLFYLTEQSDFLCGREKDWKCSFDWLMDNNNNYIKVLEGQYTNKNKSSGNPFKDKLKEMIEDDQSRDNSNHVGYQGGLSKLLQEPNRD
jgi:hypothetical protein